MLQPYIIDLERKLVVEAVQSTKVPSTILKTAEQLQNHTEPLNTGTLLTRLCTGCKIPFKYNYYSISNPHRRGITCLGCNKLFSFVSREDMYRRLKRIENGCVDSIGDEARHLNTYYLHPLIRTDLYHFPLSPNYYIKQINKDGKEEYIHHSTHENTGEVYTRCSDCTAFVKRKRKTLKTATQKALGTGVASYDSLMEFMINSNTTCALTGIKGSWSSFPGDPMYLLSLDHKIPLRAGGSSYIDNLQVTLQSFNNIKGDFEAEDFKRWFTAIKQMPKV